MGRDSFAFMVTLVNELENLAINRRTVDRLVEKVDGHPKTIWWDAKCTYGTAGGALVGFV